jgi:hypothetical protein
VSRTPKSDEQEPNPAHAADAGQVWSVDAEGSAILVAQDEAANVDPSALAANMPGADVGVEVAPYAYDGHVPLVLEAHELAGVDAAFDLLTTSHDLFDVPMLDTPAAADDTSTS